MEQNSQHHIPASNPLFPSFFLEHHFWNFWIFIFFPFIILAQGKNQSYPSEGGDSCSARRRFPCVSSFTAVLDLWPLPLFLFLPRFVELKCSSRKEGQWMHTWFCFKQTNSFHWWCWWHINNDINKIGSWQADMFHYESDSCGFSSPSLLKVKWWKIKNRKLLIFF